MDWIGSQSEDTGMKINNREEIEHHSLKPGPEDYREDISVYFLLLRPTSH